MKYLSVILLARGSLVLRADFRNYLGPQNGGSRHVERLESGSGCRGRPGVVCVALLTQATRVCFSKWINWCILYNGILFSARKN